jgi:histidinol-phosphate phosphatase family protein
VNAAVFLDRDGTLIEDPGYLSDPSLVRLLSDVGPALRRLTEAGFDLAVVSNQSGIGRGLITTAQVEAVNAAVADRLAEYGVPIAAWAYCPHLPTAGCDCRKPGTALHRAIARAASYDLARCWCVGDRISDVTPAAPLGAHAILVETGDGHHHADAARAAGIPVVATLADAVAVILATAP